MNKQALEAYLEFFTQVAGNDGEPWRRVSESDYSPFDSIVDKDGEPILEIGFSMRTGEPFLCWRGCGLAQLILELPATIPEITKRAIKAEDLKALCQELVEALQQYERWEADILLENDCWHHPSGRPLITQELWDRAVELQKVRNRALCKAKEVLEDGS